GSAARRPGGGAGAGSDGVPAGGAAPGSLGGAPSSAAAVAPADTAAPTDSTPATAMFAATVLATGLRSRLVMAAHLLRLVSATRRPMSAQGTCPQNTFVTP